MRFESISNRLWTFGITLSVMAVLLMPGAVAADWQIYVAPGMGISTASVETDGQAGGAPVTNLGGTDDDASPLIGLAVGLEVPMDELVPREWLLDVRLPDWPVRFEVESDFLREYEFRTDAEGEDFFTNFEVTATFFFNTWLDIPLLAAYRPVQFTFGLGRQPRVRRWLEPASFYLGAGVGFSQIDIDGTSNVFSGDDTPLDFAWNAGAGFNYALTERVLLSAGYRFVGFGTHKIDIEGAFTPGTNDEVEFDPEAHEFRMAIRIRVFDFASPWR
jgi:opacity protein-like surface antigen